MGLNDWRILKPTHLNVTFIQKKMLEKLFFLMDKNVTFLSVKNHLKKNYNKRVLIKN